MQQQGEKRSLIIGSLHYHCHFLPYKFELLIIYAATYWIQLLSTQGQIVSADPPLPIDGRTDRQHIIISV